MTEELEYRDFIVHGHEVEEPVDGLAVYEHSRNLHCDRGKENTRYLHKAFAVVDVDTEGIIHQTDFIDTKNENAIENTRARTIGYRDGYVNGEQFAAVHD